MSVRGKVTITGTSRYLCEWEGPDGCSKVNDICIASVCVSRTHSKSIRGRRFSYKLGLNKQVQFLVCASYNLSFQLPRTHQGPESIPLQPSEGSMCYQTRYQVIWNWRKFWINFVTCSQWCLGCVFEVHMEAVQISLTLLHPSGPFHSWLLWCTSNCHFPLTEIL